MNKGFVSLAALFALGSAVSVGCSNDKSSGGSGGMDAGADSSSADGAGGGSGGSGTGGSSTGGAGGTGGSSTGGAGGTGGATDGGAGTGGTDSGAGGAEAGQPDAGPDGTAMDAGDAGGALIARGVYLVRTVALCGGCHTDRGGGQELAGNPNFKGGSLPTPNLTPDPSGLGDWSDDQIINAFRNGIDDEGRHLDKAMPYWLFHNLSDDDAQAIVAFLRSLTPVNTAGDGGDAGPENPDATPVTPLDPSDFPDSTLTASDTDYAAAQTGKYLLAGGAQCVRCHSPSSSGLPAQDFFSGSVPTSFDDAGAPTQIFAPNLTPDATGLSGWTANDIATALKTGVNKDGLTLCGAMPAASKGYGGLTDDDARAIGVYLTTIPGVANAAADYSTEPACP